MWGKSKQVRWVLEVFLVFWVEGFSCLARFANWVIF